jgi:hypothetical protein
MAHDRETQRIVEPAGTRIIRTDFKEKGPRPATPRALDDGTEKQAGGPAAAMAWIDGYGEKLGLVGNDPANGHADVEGGLGQQEAGDTRRRQQTGNVLSRPAALADRLERLAMEPRRPIEVDCAQWI